jgi:hypothetical protein
MACSPHHKLWQPRARAANIQITHYMMGINLGEEGAQEA